MPIWKNSLLDVNKCGNLTNNKIDELMKCNNKTKTNNENIIKEIICIYIGYHI